MILSPVLDGNLMHSDNIAEGYDIFTGKGSQPDDVYGEIHTGDAWEPARQLFSVMISPIYHWHLLFLETNHI
jgi:hypothetical protein